MKLIRKHFFILFAIGCSSIFAQIKTNDLPLFSLNVKDGLSQNYITCSIQDFDRYIWIGTRNGLYKYDGYNFEQIDIRNKGGDVNHIYCLFKDSSQNLWIGTDRGPVQYNYTTGDVVPLFTQRAVLNEAVNTFFQSDDQTIWMGTVEGNLLSYNTSDQTINRYSHPNFKNISDIISVGTNTLLVGFKFGGLLSFSIKNKKFGIPEGFGGIDITSINTMINLGPETVLAATPKGVFLYRVDHTPTKLNNNLDSTITPNALKAVISLFMVDDKKVWLGTDGHGIFEYDILTGKLESIRFQDLSHSFTATSMFRAKDNSLWIGTTNQGIKIINPYKSRFNHWSFEKGNKTGLSSNSVLALMETDQGNIVLGMDGGGVNLFDPDTKLFEHYYKGLEDKRVNNALVQDDKNRIWAGTYNYGYHVSKYSNYNGLEPLNVSVPKEIENISIKALLRDDHDNIWIGTVTDGIYHYQPKTGQITKFKEKNPLIQNAHVYCIYQTADSKIWFGCYSGLYVYDPKNETLEEFFPQNGSHFSQVTSIVEVEGNNIWLGTKTGLYNIERDSNKTTLYTTEQGLPSNVVNSLLVDSAQFLWLATDKGLSRLDPLTKEFRNFGREDGIHGLEFNENARLKDSKGTLYFGNTNGVYFFHPNQIKTNPISPEIILTNFKVTSGNSTTSQNSIEEERPINQVEKINLNHDQNSFTLHFTALNFTNPNKNQYKYKLLGFNQDWVFTSNERNAIYTNIPPGEYSFKVHASNNDGVWSILPKTLKITIHPPWWQTWWAQLLFFILIAGSIILANTYILRQIYLKNSLKVERREKNDQIQLNEFKTRFFTNLTHELRTPLTMILSPLDKLITNEIQGPEYKNQLISIQRNAENLLKIINEWLDYRKTISTQLLIRAKFMDLYKFTQDIAESFKELASDKSIVITYIPPSTSINCYFDPRAIEKVISNLVSNAIKYSGEGSNITIQVGISTDRPDNTPYAFFKIDDEGRGISFQEQERIFKRFNSAGENLSMSSGIGLSLSKELVEAHHGTLEFVSVPEKGSTFKVFLPLGRGHFTEEQLSDASDNKYIPMGAPKRSGIQKDAISDLNLIDNLLIESDYTVLLVEDEDEIREFIARELVGFFKVIEAKNGEEGLSKALESIPDLILSDVLMPITTGLELCRSLKNNLKTSHIPIILLTALSDEESRVQGLKEGAEDYITKPFSVNSLFFKIKSIIENRKLIAQKYQIETIMRPKELAQSTPDKDFLEKTVKIIHDNISEPNFTIDKLVMELGMSRTPFFKKIKSLTNLTPNEFLKVIRLRHAAQLLLKTGLNISEISFEIGFLSSNYFRTTFKKQFGETPSDYRERRITKT